MPDPLQTNSEVPPLFKIGPPRQKSASTLAGEVAARTTGKRHRQILQLLNDRGPMTLFELAAHMHVQKNQISGRISELVRELFIERTGERRKDPVTKCTADTVRIRPEGIAELQRSKEASERKSRAGRTPGATDARP